MKRLAITLAFTLAAAACATSVPVPAGPLPTIAPADRHQVRADSVQVDGRTVVANFTGGPIFDPDDACSIEYAMDADIIAGDLQISIYSIRNGRLSTPRPDGVLLTCGAMGYPRTASVELDRPFLGTVVRDLAGGTHLVEPPAGLVVLRDLPAAWELVAEEDVPESPTGRWMRRWALDGDLEHTMELYQAFDGPASVTGGQEITRVDVGDETGTLYRQREVGELVLVWFVGTDGVALVANERDLSVEELIRLAESAACPGGCR